MQDRSLVVNNGAPVRLMDFIEAIETELGVKAEKNMLPIQPRMHGLRDRSSDFVLRYDPGSAQEATFPTRPGDVPATWADCSALERDTGYRPNTDVRDGIDEFVKWCREFYRV